MKPIEQAASATERGPICFENPELEQQGTAPVSVAAEGAEERVSKKGKGRAKRKKNKQPPAEQPDDSDSDGAERPAKLRLIAPPRRPGDGEASTAPLTPAPLVAAFNDLDPYDLLLGRAYSHGEGKSHFSIRGSEIAAMSSVVFKRTFATNVPIRQLVLQGWSVLDNQPPRVLLKNLSTVLLDRLVWGAMLRYRTKALQRRKEVALKKRGGLASFDKGNASRENNYGFNPELYLDMKEIEKSVFSEMLSTVVSNPDFGTRSIVEFALKLNAFEGCYGLSNVSQLSKSAMEIINKHCHPRAPVLEKIDIANRHLTGRGMWLGAMRVLAIGKRSALTVRSRQARIVALSRVEDIKDPLLRAKAFLSLSGLKGRSLKLPGLDALDNQAIKALVKVRKAALEARKRRLGDVDWELTLSEAVSVFGKYACHIFDRDDVIVEIVRQTEGGRASGSAEAKPLAAAEEKRVEEADQEEDWDDDELPLLDESVPAVEQQAGMSHPLSVAGPERKKSLDEGAEEKRKRGCEDIALILEQMDDALQDLDSVSLLGIGEDNVDLSWFD